MKVCHIVPSLEEQRGGPSKSVRALCIALSRAGHEVELLTTAQGAPKAGESATDEGIRIRTFRRDWPDRLCPSAGLQHALQTTSAEVIHHHSIWLRTLHYAHRAAGKLGSTLVVSPRGMMSEWAWRHHRWRKRFARRIVHPLALEAVAGWHVTSSEEDDEIRALGFRQPICVAPNAVDAPHEQEIAAAAAYWHEACPEANGRRVALFYSRFHPKKRVLELIDLWLEHGSADWLLLLVGIPQDYTAAMLERYVMKMSGPGRVRAFDGLGKPPPYAVASLFVLPSHSENFGLAIAEAMAHGVPVVVTDTTPWSSLSTDARGWCVPWASFPAAIAAATAEAPDRLRERGERARKWVLTEFSWARSASALAAFYARLRAGTDVTSP